MLLWFKHWRCSMERDLWKFVVRALKRVPPTRPRNAAYHDREIVAVLLWAALHSRPVSWACQRSTWPPQAWRRRLPDQSTMSRRLRRPEILRHLRAVVVALQEDGVEASSTLIVDGKALQLSDHSRDPDARVGMGVRRYAKGYRLHVMIDDQRRLLAWRVRPLNEAECVVAQSLLRDAVRWSSRLVRPQALLIGDASYDSNRLHLRAATLRLHLVAPRRKPTQGVAKSRVHHRSRRRSIALTEGVGSGRRRRWLKTKRREIERFFGALASAGTGLSHLPTWVRGQHRCDLWVGAKLAIDAARRAFNAHVAA